MTDAPTTECGTGNLDTLLTELVRIEVLADEEPGLLSRVEGVEELWKDWRYLSPSVISRVVEARGLLFDHQDADGNRPQPTAADSGSHKPGRCRNLLENRGSTTGLSQVIHKPTGVTTSVNTFISISRREEGRVSACRKACAAKVGAGMLSLKSDRTAERMQGVAALLRSAARDLDDAVSLLHDDSSKRSKK